ncbi:MAG: flagellar M-ring protein FliF, partial [Rhodothermales bacterium]|nr:flagellar M-ring protein FliF [Rhodothermales bacterium]
MNGFLEQIISFFRRLPMQQRLAVAGVLVGGIAVLGSVAYWASAPNYVLLYSGMDQADTGQVIESLRSRGVEYELRDSGNAIYVPEEQVYELRASLAQTGVVSDGAPGHEKIFGGGTLG